MMSSIFYGADQDILLQKSLGGFIIINDGFSLAEAVALAGIQLVEVWNTFRPQRGHDFLRLGGWHDLILRTLEDGQRPRDLVHMEERRPGLVFGGCPGQYAHQLEV